jgi:hypothetical protein
VLGFFVLAAGKRMGNTQRRLWSELPAEEQLALREAYGHYLDTLPPTCELAEKLARFRRWLDEQGVVWDGS